MPPRLLFLSLSLAFGLTGCDIPEVREEERPPQIRELRPGEGPDIPALADARWFLTDFGWIVASDDAGIDSVAIEMQGAAKAFATHFASVPGRGAVIDLGFATHAGTIKAAGAEWVMHWQRPDPEGKGDGVSGRLRPFGELRHEIGHMLFISHIWPNTRGRQYGGDAPDWLDETAAVLMETAAITRQRRVRFGDMDSAGRIIPLTDYLDMIHPFFDSQLMQDLLRSSQGKDPPARGMVSAPLPRGYRALEIDFYAQTRGFIDFLLETTGEDRVFLEIALFLKAGGTLDGWLAESETARVAGLGGTVEALERRWLDWIDARYRGLSPEPRRHP